MVQLEVEEKVNKSTMDPEKRRMKKEKRKAARLAATIAKNEGSSVAAPAASSEDEKEEETKPGFEAEAKDSSEETPALTKAQKKKLKKKEAKKKAALEAESKMEVEETKEETKEEEKPKKKKNKNKKRKQVEEEAVEEKKEEEETRVEEPTKKKKKKDKKATEEEAAPAKPLTKKAEGTFKKSFYTPTAATNALSSAQINTFLKEHSANITSSGDDDSSTSFKPIMNFDDAGVDKRCMKGCKGFEKPTPIQSLCWPIISSGRDIVGIAETGSGKTLAFSVPALAHMLHRKESGMPQGVSQSPMMLVVAPTRELAMQSQEVLMEAGKLCGLRSTCLYGGVPKFHQRKDLKAGFEVVVATPGRLLDLVEEGACDLSGVSYLVLDEADRMLDQGFERAIRSIISQTHPERQTCLFSATWPESIREMANEFMVDPVRVTIGSEDLAAGKKVTQIVEVVEDRSRDARIQKLLTQYHKNDNRILVFVLYKKEADRVLGSLQRNGWNCGAIHGDRSQDQRTAAMEAFKKGTTPILVATDVAARGLDIPDVEYVINYAFPLTIEDYVHRIGRTGRAGKSGIAHTFFQACDKLRAGELVKVLKDSNQKVPEDMNQFDLCIKRKEHKLYGSFGPKSHLGPMKAATKIKFD